MRITRPDEPTSRSLLGPLVAAASLLVVIAATVNLFPAWLLDRPAESTEVSLSAEPPVADAAAATDVYVPLTGLIDPHNGDNGTDPAQTTTGACVQCIFVSLLKGELFVSCLKDELWPRVCVPVYQMLARCTHGCTHELTAGHVVFLSESTGFVLHLCTDRQGWKP